MATSAPSVATVAGTFYVDPASSAAVAATAAGDSAEAALLHDIADQPTATWIGDWLAPADVGAYVRRYVATTRAAGRIGVLVLYEIPGRDCGQYSAGGLAEHEYTSWIDAVAEGLRGSETWVIVEPDALAGLGDCDGQGDRVALLTYAATTLSSAGARVYLDAGHSRWQSAETMADRLRQVGIEHLAGFALNTSNYNAADDERAYGERIVQLLGGGDLGFVIDTSRSGRGGVAGQWCNVRGQALGPTPRLIDDGTRLDAYLWVKRPGESDGTCGGGPPAGHWWQEAALELARNARADQAKD